MNRTELARKFAENFDAELILQDFTSSMRDVKYRQRLRSNAMEFDHPLLSKAFWRAKVMDVETELGYLEFVEDFLKGVEGRFLEEEVKEAIVAVDKAVLAFSGIRNYRVNMADKVIAVEKMNAITVPDEKRILIDHSVTNPDHIAIIITLDDGEKVFFNALHLAEGESVLGFYLGVGDMMKHANNQVHTKEEKPTEA